jgi:hypothetical protein
MDCVEGRELLREHVLNNTMPREYTADNLNQEIADING